MNWHDLISEVTAVEVRRRRRAADHRRRIRLAPRASRRGLRRHERRLDRRQSLRRKGDRRRRARHHHRFVADLRPSARLSTRHSRPRSRARPPRACRSFGCVLRSSRAQARRHRHHRHQRQNHHVVPRPKPCSTPPAASQSSSARSNITSPAKCGPRCTPRPSRAISSS